MANGFMIDRYHVGTLVWGGIALRNRLLLLLAIENQIKCSNGVLTRSLVCI